MVQNSLKMGLVILYCLISSMRNVRSYAHLVGAQK